MRGGIFAVLVPVAMLVGCSAISEQTTSTLELKNTGDEQPSKTAELKSLQGDVTFVFGDSDEGMPAKFWAKGNKMRTEVSFSSATVVSLQIDGTMYTFEKGGNTGRKAGLGSGLGAMGIIKQIAEIKANGEEQATKEIEGEPCAEYTYTRNASREVAVVFLSVRTSLPKVWISWVKNPDGTASKMTMFYRNLKVNAEIPDTMFDLPKGLTFSE